MRQDILTNSFILSVGILLGRVSGYIRELVIAYKFNVSVDADNIILMLTVPDLLNNLLLSGAISGLMIPLLAKEGSFKEEILHEFIYKIFKITTVLYIVLALILLFIYSHYLYFLILISLVSVFPNILTFVSVSFLQYKKRFRELSLNTLFFNGVLILFLLLGFNNYYFATAIILASIFRMFWMIYNIDKTGISIRNILTNKKVNTRKRVSYSLMIFMIFANGVIFILPMIDKIFASFLKEGSIALLSYAEKIYFLPVSVFLTTYAVAMFPDLSKMIADNKQVEVNKLLNKSILFNILISIGIAFIIYFFSTEIVRFFYAASKMKNSNMILISEVLNSYIIAIILAGSNSILINLFFANKWYKILVYYSVFILTLKLIINYIINFYNFDVKYIPMGTSFILLVSVFSLFITYKIKSKTTFI